MGSDRGKSDCLGTGCSSFSVIISGTVPVVGSWKQSCIVFIWNPIASPFHGQKDFCHAKGVPDGRPFLWFSACSGTKPAERKTGQANSDGAFCHMLFLAASESVLCVKPIPAERPCFPPCRNRGRHIHPSAVTLRERQNLFRKSRNSEIRKLRGNLLF